MLKSKRFYQMIVNSARYRYKIIRPHNIIKIENDLKSSIYRCVRTYIYPSAYIRVDKMVIYMIQIQLRTKQFHGDIIFARGLSTEDHSTFLRISSLTKCLFARTFQKSRIFVLKTLLHKTFKLFLEVF